MIVRGMVRGGLALLVAAAAAPGVAAAAERGASSGQAVVEWNQIARDAIVRAPGSTVSTAMVQVAVYDAVAAIDGRYEPFATRIDAPRRASQEAATAAAAHRLLVLEFPGQAPLLDQIYAEYLARIPDGQAKAAGIWVGERAAEGTFEFREGDRRYDNVPYVQPPSGPGVFEPTLPSPPQLTVMAVTRPFAMRSPSQFRPDGPLWLSSARYAEEFDEVKRFGRQGENGPRTREQTATALFWADGSVSQWNRALQRIATDHTLRLVDAARMFALASVAGADSAIACFEAKYHYTFWRPIHAIQRAGTDGNDATQPDPDWQPLLQPTPNHPEYPSGHGCYAAAVTTALAASFGRDRVSWSVNSAVSGETRHYRRFSDAVAEVIDARVWAGIHFRSSNVEGAQLGRRVARWVISRHFQRDH